MTLVLIRKLHFLVTLRSEAYIFVIRERIGDAFILGHVSPTLSSRLGYPILSDLDHI